MGEKYRTIVADPPWPIKWQGGPGGRRRNQTELGYETLSFGEITGLNVGDRPVREVVAPDALLFLWVTGAVLREGHGATVARAWGFKPVGELIWAKPNFGAGAFPRIGHEVCMVCKRGAGALSQTPRDVHSVQTWKQDYSNNGGKKHSAKPDGFYDLVERVGLFPMLELFARSARFRWDYHGDESLQTVELA